MNICTIILPFKFYNSKAKKIVQISILLCVSLVGTKTYRLCWWWLRLDFCSSHEPLAWYQPPYQSECLSSKKLEHFSSGKINIPRVLQSLYRVSVCIIQCQPCKSKNQIHYDPKWKEKCSLLLCLLWDKNTVHHVLKNILFL